jgi:hypothetical protein
MTWGPRSSQLWRQFIPCGNGLRGNPGPRQKPLPERLIVHRRADRIDYPAPVQPEVAEKISIDTHPAAKSHPVAERHLPAQKKAGLGCESR